MVPRPPNATLTDTLSPYATLFRAQEQVLGDLLADRAGPAHPAAAGVAGARLLDGLEVETAVAGAVLVLGRDQRQRQAGRDLVHVAPVVGNAGIPERKRVVEGRSGSGSGESGGRRAHKKTKMTPH